MIEVIADLEIERVDDSRIDRDDGHEHIRGRVTELKTERVRVHLEMHGKDGRGGHVNLEGYAVGNYDFTASRAFSRYVDLGPDDRIDDDASTVEMRGEARDWIGAASRYQDERPDRDLMEILDKFQRWDVTEDRALERAKGLVESGKADVILAEMRG